MSCSTNTEGVLLCSTQFVVLSRTGSLYLAVNRQGTIVYNLPPMPPVIYLVIFQLAFDVERTLNMRAKDISVVTMSKLGNSSGEWLRTEHTPETEPKTAKHESSEPIRVGLTSQSCIPCQFQIDESLSDTYGNSECSGKPSYNVSCDMPGSCKSLVYTN